MINPLIQPLQLYLVLPKSIEALFYLFIIYQLSHSSLNLKWNDRPLVLKFFLIGMCGWFLYISLDIVIYIIAPLSMAGVDLPFFISGYPFEYPSLFWANIFRDIGFFGASVILWCYVFCSITIRFGEVKTVQFFNNHKIIYVIISLLTVFIIVYDNIGVTINDSGVNVNAIFDGVSGFSLILYISLYMISAIMLYRGFTQEKFSHMPTIPKKEIGFIGWGVFLMGFGNTYWILIGILETIFPNFFTFNVSLVTTFFGHGIWGFSPILIFKGLRVPLNIRPKQFDYGEAGMQQFRMYVESSLLALFIVQNGKIIYVNPYFAQLMEVPKEILETWTLDHFLDRIYLDDAIMVLEQLSKRAQPGEMGGFITYRLNAGLNLDPENIHLKWIQHFSNVITYRGDSMIQNILLDITDQKKLEEKFKESEIRQQKLESLSLLAGGIAHDFNNLLNILTGNLSLLQLMVNDGPSKEQMILDLQNFLPDMENACQHAMKLTNQLLTFSKGGAPLKKPVRVDQLIEESVKLALSGSKANYSFEIEKNLPAVDVDPNQIIQVFSNLLLNADQAMPNGGKITIRAGLVTLDEMGSAGIGISNIDIILHPGSYVIVAIQDTGTGIPKELGIKIFDPYFTTKVKGTGMGLTTCLSIIKRHGGAITFESELNRGTTFDVYLPISLENPIEEESAQAFELNVKGSILIMDDNEAILRALSRMVNSLGFQVDTATNGNEAIAKYNNAINLKNSYRAVILDLIIPGGLGGKDTLLELKKINPDIIAIVSSGYSNDPIMANYQEYGFSGVLSKPYSMDQLKNILANSLKIQPA